MQLLASRPTLDKKKPQTLCTWHERSRGWVVGVVPREVDPLWVAKLVAHEVEVALPTTGHGEQADHLVQRNAAVNDGGAGAVA